jgi:hypothetical protein
VKRMSLPVPCAWDWRPASVIETRTGKLVWVEGTLLLFSDH